MGKTTNVDILLTMCEQATKDELAWLQSHVTKKYSKKDWQIYQHAYQQGWIKAVYAAKLHNMIKGVDR